MRTGMRRKATGLSIAPSGRPTSDSVEYYAIIVLAQGADSWL